MKVLPFFFFSGFGFHTEGFSMISGISWQLDLI